ncbi:MAG: aminotransferase class I/II-fold pyridoxal phosphate-dependent enzyme [bacterium]|jgi:cystathionine beta-lyase family protein involved in aluminum resistance
MTESWPVADDAIVLDIEKAIQPQIAGIEKVRQINAAKVLAAFQAERVGDSHFAASTGYAYGDLGRETLDRLFARVFGTEAALVRSQIVSGTHAIALCLYALLRPGDELVCPTGAPYDTLAKVIGLGAPAPGSLAEFGVRYRQVELRPDGGFDAANIAASLTPAVKVVLIQRSRGYSWRKALSVREIGELIELIKKDCPDVVCLVDNCYGEFTEAIEPSEVGADLVAGSLIKNPGGGLAPSGGYIAGKEEYVAAVADRLTAPGLGGEVGASLSGHRLFYQGFYFAPHVVGEALAGAVFTAELFERLGFTVSPRPGDTRSDIIQAIQLGTPERVIAFCQGIQAGSPVDAFVAPEPWEMPGYSDPVIMAAGTFVQGASIELSADAPLRPPYIVYLQGGLAREYSRLAILNAWSEMARRNIL